MNSSEKTFFEKDDEIYGSHNCHVNAITLLLRYFQVDLTAFHIFNMNVNIGDNNHHFGGNAPYKEILEFLRKAYGFKVFEYDFASIPQGELLILPMDSYYLSYIENIDVIVKGEQLHYVIAKVQSEKTMIIYDPYYRKYSEFDKETLARAWSEFMLPIAQIVIDDTAISKSPESGSVAPYVLSIDYREKYDEFYSEFKNMMMQFSSKDLSDSELYKRYFSCLKSMLIVRKKHFAVWDNEQAEYVQKIVLSWSGLFREMSRMSMRINTNFEALFEKMDVILKLELEYLDNFKVFRIS